MRGPLRLLTDSDGTPLRTFDEAQDAFREAWKSARIAHVDLMAVVSGHWVRLLHATDKTVRPTDIRLVRREAQEIADKALALVALLDDAERVVERYRRDGADL